MEFKKQTASVFLHLILTETPGHVQEPKAHEFFVLFQDESLPSNDVIS
jgi:hypothetical protein